MLRFRQPPLHLHSKYINRTRQACACLLLLRREENCSAEPAQLWAVRALERVESSLADMHNPQAVQWASSALAAG